MDQNDRRLVAVCVEKLPRKQRTLKGIAAELGIGPLTLRFHIQELRDKRVLTGYPPDAIIDRDQLEGILPYVEPESPWGHGPATVGRHRGLHG